MRRKQSHGRFRRFFKRLFGLALLLSAVGAALFFFNGRTGSVHLFVPQILQKPELPNGCEVTALASLLGYYYGDEADKCELAESYLPKEPFLQTSAGVIWGGDPELVYAGDPGSASRGYYCYPGPMVECADHWLRENNKDLCGANLTGADENELIARINAGAPVMVWCTVDMREPKQSVKTAWQIGEDGRPYIPWANLHCIVLNGYDRRNFLFVDPLGSIAAWPREDFMRIFQLLGSRAVALEKAPGL